MPPAEFLIPFLVATSVFAFTPGPGMFYMAVQTMAHGARTGWLSSIAFHIASYVHILLAAFGITILLKTAPILLGALKLAGAAYLIWMGTRMLLKRDRNSGSSPPLSSKPSSDAFRDSLTVEILNPKSALFYFAFLPQFTTPDAPADIWLQILVLGAIANAMFSITDIGCYKNGHFNLVATTCRSRRCSEVQVHQHCGCHGAQNRWMYLDWNGHEDCC